MDDIERLGKLILDAQGVVSKEQGDVSVDHVAFNGWRARCLTYLVSRFGERHPCTVSFEQRVVQSELYDVAAGMGILQAAKSEFQQGGAAVLAEDATAIDLVLHICHRFHIVARSLLDRRQGRPAVTLKDEYDVQYVMRALLSLHFDDVRSEEYVPSYAGGASRLDFLVSGEELVVETKMVRDGHTDKEVGEELIIDKNRYRSHPKCKTLVCYVYDPASLLKNPRGLENDLSESANGLRVEVVVRPE